MVMLLERVNEETKNYVAYYLKFCAAMGNSLKICRAARCSDILYKTKNVFLLNQYVTYLVLYYETSLNSMKRSDAAMQHPFSPDEMQISYSEKSRSIR